MQVIQNCADAVLGHREYHRHGLHLRYDHDRAQIRLQQVADVHLPQAHAAATGDVMRQ